jgi:hypothetical protein
METYDKFGGDGPLQPLPHPNPRDDNIRFFSILNQGEIGTFFHEFGQSSQSAVGSQLYLHDIHRKRLWRATGFVMCGGCVPRGSVAFIQSLSDSGRSTGLGIGVLDFGSCPLEDGHSDVGENWMRGSSILLFANVATLWLHRKRNKEPKAARL